MDDRYKGLLDMLDGGGMGRSGQTFEGGPLSGLMNALGIRPMGYADRLQDARPMARPASFGGAGSATPAPPLPPPITTSPLIGGMTLEQIQQAITRGAPTSPYRRPEPQTPLAPPSMAEMMELLRQRRGGQAVYDFEMGRAYPPTYR